MKDKSWFKIFDLKYWKESDGLLAKFTRFGLIGLICTIINAVIMVFLTSVCGMHYLFSFTILFVFTNFIGFILNKKYTYKASEHEFWQQLYRYYSVMFSSFLFSLAIMFVLVDLVGWSYLISYIGMAVLLTIYNFAAHDVWSFRSRPTEV